MKQNTNKPVKINVPTYKLPICNTVYSSIVNLFNEFTELAVINEKLWDVFKYSIIYTELDSFKRDELVLTYENMGRVYKAAYSILELNRIDETLMGQFLEEFTETITDSKTKLWQMVKYTLTMEETIEFKTEIVKSYLNLYEFSSHLLDSLNSYQVLCKLPTDSNLISEATH